MTWTYIDAAQSASLGVKGIFPFLYSRLISVAEAAGRAAGINFGGATTAAAAPDIAILSSKYYIAWSENANPASSSNTLIHVAVYNGNDSAPAWTSVTGSGLGAASTASGPVSLQVLSDVMYIAFAEGTTGVRVYKYNGDDAAPVWTAAGSITSSTTTNIKLAVFNSKLYGAWREGNDVRASEFSGTSTWTSIDGSAALNSQALTSSTQLDLVSFDSKMYLTWSEPSVAVGNKTQVRVKAWDGTTWSYVDGGGISKSANLYHGSHPGLQEFGGKLYLSFRERASNNESQIRVAVLSGSTWTFVDGNGEFGLNKDTAKDTDNPNLAIAKGFLYLSWREDNSSGGKSTRVAAFNGSDTSPVWTFVDPGGTDGLNYQAGTKAYSVKIRGIGDRMLASWTEGTASALVPHILHVALGQ